MRGKTRRPSVFTRLGMTLVMLAAMFVPVVTPTPVAAAGNYSNATIADKGLTHIGEKYGECWAFVRDMVYQASGGTQDISAAAGGNDYFAHLRNAGGAEIVSFGSIAKGDVVQEGQYGGHTYIVVGAVDSTHLDIVDANSDYKGTVKRYNRTVVLSSNVKAFRFGTASAQPGGGAPAGSWDTNGDGRADLVIVGASGPTGSGRLETHVLNGADGYSSWLSHSSTPAGYVNLTRDRLVMGDVNGDKRADLVIVGASGPTGSGRLETHVLNGADGFNSWLSHWATASGYVDLTRDALLMAG